MIKTRNFSKIACILLAMLMIVSAVAVFPHVNAEENNESDATYFVGSSLTVDTDNHGKISDWMLMGDVDHNGKVDGYASKNSRGRYQVECVEGRDTDIDKTMDASNLLPVDNFNKESADINNDEYIDVIDITYILDIITNTPNSDFTKIVGFRAVDVPNEGYRVTSVAVNNVVLTPDDPTDGNYKLTIGEDGTATVEVTGVCFGENTVHFNHKSTTPAAPATLELPVTKIVNGTGVPSDETYTFTIAAHDDTPEAPLPANTECEITGAGSTKFGAITYTKPGVYKYEVSEKPGNTAGFTYDSSVYVVEVGVKNVENGVEISDLVVKKVGADGKADGIVFTNAYESTIGTLTLSKKVTGEMADMDKAFSFTVTFSDDAYSFDAGDHGSITNGTGTITLKNGESVTFKNIPAGTTYTIVEKGAEAYYTTVDNNGTTVNGKSVNGSVSGGASVKVAYTNDLQYTPPTGDHMEIMPFVLLGLVALGAGVFIVKKRTAFSK